MKRYENKFYVEKEYKLENVENNCDVNKQKDLKTKHLLLALPDIMVLKVLLDIFEMTKHFS